jgi:hypothetical protein
MPLTEAKRYRAQGCKEKVCTFIANSAGRDIFQTARYRLSSTIVVHF